MTAEQNKESRPRRGRTGSWWLLAVLFLIATGVACWAILPQTAGQQIRKHLLAKLRDHYQDHYVHIDRARYEHGVGVIIEGLEIRDGIFASTSSCLVEIDRIVAETTLSIEKFLDGDLNPRKIRVSGVDLRTTIDAEGNLSAEKLFPLPKLGPGAEVVLVEDSTIVVLDVGSDNLQPFVVRELSGSIVDYAKMSAERISELEVQSEMLADDASPVLMGLKRSQFTGHTDFLQKINLVADSTKEGWMVRGRVENGALNRNVLQRLPRFLREHLDPIRGLEVTATSSGYVRGNADGVSDWGVGVDLSDGRYHSDQLPYRIDDIAGHFEVRPQGIVVQQISAKAGGSDLQVRGQTSGCSWPMPLAFTFAADELLLHDRTADNLPPKIQKVFKSLMPRGRIAANGTVRFDGAKWTWDSTIDALGIDIQFDRFPYPVKDVRGRIHCSQLQTTAKSVTGFLGGREVVGDLFLARPDLKSNNITSSVKISTLGSLPIDETLFRALTPRGEQSSSLEKLVRSFNISGTVELAASRFEKRADGSRTKMLDLRFAGGNLRYDHFPYPVYDVQGQVLVDNDVVKIVDIRGQSNDSAIVQAKGAWWKDKAGANLQLEFDCFGVPMDQSLRNALPIEQRGVWDTLGPSGAVEHLNILVGLKPGSRSPNLTITADQYQRDDKAARYVSITPPALPYRLDISRGHAQLIGDRIVIRDLDGWHGNARLTAKGRCNLRDDGRWVLSVDVMPPTRALLDKDLMEALPQEVQSTFEALDLQGPPISLRGSANFAFPTVNKPDLEFDWDLLMQLEGNRIGAGTEVRDIRGELRLVGQRQDQETSASGYVHFDSLHALDLQLVGIKGPILIRGEQLYLGQTIPAASKAERTETIVGGIFGGNAEMDGVVDLVTGKFDVNARLDKVDFPTLLRDFGHQADGTVGVGRAAVRVSGLLGDYRTLSGRGRAQLEDASLYELPVAVRLMNLLSVKPDGKSDFTNADLQFQIDGERLDFDDVRIWGDVIVLRGEGSANLRQEIDFRFETGVSPNNIWSALVRPLREQQYTLWTIDVNGTLSDPVLDKRALKQIEQALDRLFNDFDSERPPRRSAGRAARNDLLVR